MTRPLALTLALATLLLVTPTDAFARRGDFYGDYWDLMGKYDSNRRIAVMIQFTPNQVVRSAQYTSGDWRAFLRDHRLVPSMSRRGNCLDNAVAESFFQLLKRERIKRRIYASREEARQDIFNYIELFYNSTRRHGSSGNLSPINYEKSYYSNQQDV